MRNILICLDKYEIYIDNGKKLIPRYKSKVKKIFDIIIIIIIIIMDFVKYKNGYNLFKKGNQ